MPSRIAHIVARSLAAFAVAVAGDVAAAQSLVTPGIPTTPPPAAWAPPPRIIVPQLGRAAGAASLLAVTDVSANVEIRDQVATTTLEIGLVNRSPAAQEATLLVPVPSAATVMGFSFEGPAKEPTARVLGRNEARLEYDSIVARERDPALLEWAGWNLVRTSVFPVAAGGTQRIRLVWEELLTPIGDRLDYVLPRSDIVGAGPAWRVHVDVKSSATLAAVYSPTHELRTLSRSTNGATLEASDRGATSTGALRLAIVRAGGRPGEAAATVMTYPDPVNGGGWFLMLAAAPVLPRENALPRDLVLVLDRSGSMSGAPLEQAKAATLRIIDGLRDGERVNVIDFSNGVSRFADAPVALDATTRARLAAHVAALAPSGGTNIHDALLEALRQPVAAGSVPLCLFVTDGLPTIGRTLERDIRALAEKGNASQRRVFTIGLGPDVNVPLLDRIADASRALATYVTPGDDLTQRVAEVVERLGPPALTELALVATENGVSAPNRIADLQPGVLPDLFGGSTLVICGQYRGNAPFTLAAEGRAADGKRRLTVQVDPKAASVTNAFVPRLWASRRIAQLVDGIRQLGADQPKTSLSIDADPRLRELVGEIVRLATTWGILTEYTSMLALEGSRFNDWRALETACADSLNGRAVQTRSGYAAVNQGMNWNRQKVESTLAGTKAYVDASLAQVESSNLAQCGTANLWRSGQRWTEGSIAGDVNPVIDEVVIFGSDRHRQLLWELVEENRQSAIALDGEILIRHRGKNILVRNDGC
ncbi:MAG: VWA domain-containing protein [Phycisphaerae bacterium]|nr:VWA domain-containing protein [Phycisphaerae bacterium]